MTTTTPNNFNEQSINFDEEFVNPNVNYAILLTELRQQIETLQTDMAAIQDPSVLGFAQQLYVDRKVKYFNLLKMDLDMQHDLRIEDILDREKGEKNE